MGGCDGNRIIYDGAREKRIDSFLGGKNLRLVSINKLGQLCKYIFDREIEQGPIQASFKFKIQIFWIGKTLSIKSKVSYTGIDHSYDSLIQRNPQKWYVAAILKRFKITKVMSKPNDSRQR